MLHQLTMPKLQAGYEPPVNAELTLRGDSGDPAGEAMKVVCELERRGWVSC